MAGILRIYLPVKSVGVMGDSRSHDYTSLCQGYIPPTDGMTADIYYFKEEFP